MQFIDGDCALQPGWIDTAQSFLDENPQAAVVHGRRRERHPEATIYNQLCDWEWDRPAGQAKSCGGDAMIRVIAFQAVGGYNSTLIAGEEPELCVRLRAQNWQIWCLDAEMTLHDAAMTRFSQYSKRAQRAGYAYAEGAEMHGDYPERHGVLGRNRAVFWGIGLPISLIILTLFQPIAFLGLIAYPIQITRVAVRINAPGNLRWKFSILLILSKFFEAYGVIKFYGNKLRGRPQTLIEYK